MREIPRRNARRYPNKTALVFEGTRFTFKEFNNRINSMTNALVDLGVRKGDRIAVIADNCHQYVELPFIAAKGGMVISPLHPTLSARDLIFLLNNAGANTIVFTENYLDTIHNIRPELESVKNMIVIGNPQDDVKNYEDLVAEYPSEEPEHQVDENALLFLPCSGGTTGFPKQVMHTHRSCFFIMLDMLWAFENEHEDICLVPVPIFWGATVPYLLFPHSYMGCTLVVSKDFSPDRVLNTIEEEKITTALLGSNYLNQLMNSPAIEKCDLRSLRRVAVTGAPLSEERWKKAIQLFGNVFLQTYGLTEVAPITCFPPEGFVLEDSPEKPKTIHSCGKEAQDIEIRIVNEEGKPVPTGETGEVIVKGPAVMAGYWNAPKATREAIKDSYLYTGDMARMDEAGYLYLAGRKKDIISIQDHIVFPSEIEDIIYRHPRVQEVAVIGVPEKGNGESIEAVVVLEKGEKISAEEIIELCHQYLPQYAIPRSVKFVSSLPKSAVGKVLKSVLRDRA